MKINESLDYVQYLNFDNPLANILMLTLPVIFGLVIAIVYVGYVVKKKKGLSSILQKYLFSAKA